MDDQNHLTLTCFNVSTGDLSSWTKVNTDEFSLEPTN